MRVECSIVGCPRTTGLDRWADPRDRWMLEVPLKDGDDVIHVDLCPAHVRELFNLQERDYVELERTEKIISETNGGVAVC